MALKHHVVGKCGLHDDVLDSLRIMRDLTALRHLDPVLAGHDQHVAGGIVGPTLPQGASRTDSAA
jgi:hypothetical protein